MHRTVAEKNFFRSILNLSAIEKIDKLVIVTHLVPGSDEFLLTVNEEIPIAMLIPKPNSIDKQVKDKVIDFIPILHFTRDEIKRNKKKFLELLQKHIGNDTFAVVDIGGYFSHVLDEMQYIFGSKFIGVVEDTENGHQKYETLLLNENHTSLPCPVISVARSSLKDSEDFLVGHAIVFSAEALLREEGEILTGKQAVVLGYGKIGRSIANSLRSKGVRVDVIDTNSSRQVLALAHDFHTNKKDVLLENADLLFCATGNHSLKQSDLPKMKNNSYIFTATSADDEIEEHLLIMENAVPHPNKKISQLEVAGKQLFLCNNGNSANFMHGGVVGPFIKLVQAEIIFALSQLSRFPNDKVYQISDESKSFISDLWLDFYAKR